MPASLHKFVPAVEAPDRFDSNALDKRCESCRIPRLQFNSLRLAAETVRNPDALYPDKDDRGGDRCKADFFSFLLVG